MSDRLLDIRKAAAMLGRSENGLRQMVARRQIPYRKVGSRVMFVESELTAFIQALPGLSLEDVRMFEQVKVADFPRGIDDV